MVNKSRLKGVVRREAECRDLFTIQHGHEYLIAFIKQLPHNK